MDAKKRLWIYAGLAMATGVGLVVAAAPAAPVIPRRLGPGARLLVVGDSLALGLATPLKQLAKDGGVVIDVQAKTGTRIDQWASSPPNLAFKPTVILVSLGTNDMKLPNPGLERPSLDRLVATLRSTGATVLWIAPPAMPFPDRGVRAMLAGAGVPVFGSLSLTIPRGSDAIHPTLAGYAGWAGTLWKWVDRS